MIEDVPVVCAGCGTPTKQAVKGRCPRCAGGHELERTTSRGREQPWSRLYTHRRWRRARLELFERDDHTCQLRHPGCLGGRRLRAHHRPRKLEQLWAIARGDWSAFVELACDLDGLVTACEPCHVVDDRKGGVGLTRRAARTVRAGAENPGSGSWSFFSAAIEQAIDAVNRPIDGPLFRRVDA